MLNALASVVVAEDGDRDLDLAGDLETTLLLPTQARNPPDRIVGGPAFGQERLEERPPDIGLAVGTMVTTTMTITTIMEALDKDMDGVEVPRDHPRLVPTPATRALDLVLPVEDRSPRDRLYLGCLVMSRRLKGFRNAPIELATQIVSIRS